MPKLKFIALLISVAVLGTVALALRPASRVPHVWVATARASERPMLLPLAANALTALVESNPFGLLDPVAQFKDRISKKTFGMYITPDTSPVDRDRFAGFHTGVDAEFTDTTVDIPVSAITDGMVVLSKWATGYGGVVVIRHIIMDIPVFALYGHLDPASLVTVGTPVSPGQRLGILGDDHSEETDDVRKHLHFSLYAGEKMDVRGYVPAETDLANWMDPLLFF